MKGKVRFGLALGSMLCAASWASAAVVWSDGFESGLSWTNNLGGVIASTEQAHSGSYSAKTDSSGDRIYNALPAGAIVGKPGADPFTFTYWLYDDGGARGFSQLVSYSTWGSGLQQLFAIGKYNTTDWNGETHQATKYQARITNMGATGSWFNLNAAGSPNRSNGWHRFDIIFDPGANTANFYVDGILGRSMTGVSAPVQGFTYVSAGLGAGSTAEAFYYDSFSIDVVPEPATIALLAAGGLLLRRRRVA